MSLFEIYELIEFICNKDFAGNIITPENYKKLIKVANMDLFRKKTGLSEQFQPGRPIPLEYADITLKNTDDIKPFKVYSPNALVTNGILPFPSNYAHREEVRYNYQVSINGVTTSLPRPVEILREGAFTERKGNYTKRPTTKNPIGVVRNGGIYIEPSSITQVDFTYLRWPTDPVFAYTEHDGYITYNAGGSVELEWPVDNHISIVAILLSYIGVNLREPEIFQYAELKKQKGE